MRIISIIEDQEVIDKILGHLGLCQKNQRPPPKTLDLQIDYSDSQLPFYEDQNSGLPQIPHPFKGNSGSRGSILFNFWESALLFPLIPNIGKVQIHKVLFSSVVPLWPPAFGLFFSLILSFPYFILFP